MISNIEAPEAPSTMSLYFLSEIKNTLCNKKYIIVFLIFIFSACFLIIFIVDYYYVVKLDMKNKNAIFLDLINQRTISLFSEINNFPRGAGDDVLFLSGLSSLNNFINNRNNIQYRKILESDFLKFLRENTAYYQLRYINEKGQETVRVDFKDDEYLIIPRDKLQNKSKRYYFDATMEVGLRNVYISFLDLNIENSKIENRGTEDSPTYVPTIRYATPIFDKDGNNNGIIIANIYADYFLEDIRRFQKKGEYTFLVDSRGYYLANPDKNKEFSFLFNDKNYNLLSDYPMINGNNETLFDCNNRQIEIENLIFTYHCIYPRLSSFETYQGSKKIFGTNAEDDYFWVLITITDKNEMQNIFKEYKNNYIWSLMIRLFIISIIITLVSFLITNSFNGLHKSK